MVQVTFKPVTSPIREFVAEFNFDNSPKRRSAEGLIIEVT